MLNISSKKHEFVELNLGASRLLRGITLIIIIRTYPRLNNIFSVCCECVMNYLIFIQIQLEPKKSMCMFIL